MLRDKDLNLTKAVDTCRDAEISDLHLKALSTSDPEKSINAVRRERGRNISQKKYTSYQEHGGSHVSQRHGNVDTTVDRSGPRYSKQSIITNDNRRVPKHKQCGYHILDCRYCGYEHQKGKCPAYGEQWRKCGKINHYARVCQNTKRHVHHIGDDCLSDEDYDDEYENRGNHRKKVHLCNGCGSTSTWQQKLVINGKTAIFSIDTGADCNITNMDTFKWVTSRYAQHVHSPRVPLTAFGGSKLKILGQVSLVVNHRRVTFEIVGNDQRMPNIIGRQSSVMLGLVKRVHMMQCSNILSRYADLFTGVGCLR